MRPDGRKYRTRRLAWRDEALREIALPSGRLTVTRGIGSGLANLRHSVPDRIWAICDRGPNLKVEDAVPRFGLEALHPFVDLDGARIMPCLDHGPAVAELRIDEDTVSLVRSWPLRGTDGRPLTGLPPAAGVNAECEPAFSLEGAALIGDPSGLDSEGIAALAGGGFWVADEYGPSLLRVDEAGTVTVRWVPAGTEPLFEGAAYPVAALLPAVASARRLNRGFEALALTPDEQSLFVAFQSPLAHPDRAAHKSGRNVRLWRLDAATGRVLAEYVYLLEPPRSFRRDLALGRLGPDDIKVSEAIALGENRLLILERGSASAKFYRIDLLPEHEVPAAYLDRGRRPTLEQLDEAGLAAAGIWPLTKTLILDTDDAPEICGDLEGAVLVSPRALILVNDNDFGVDGVETQFWRVTFDEDLI